MLTEHTLNQLRALRLDGMVHALEDQASAPAAAELPFDDRLTPLVQRKIAWRDDRCVARLLKAARLKVSAACIEDINGRATLGLNRALVRELAGCDRLRRARSLLITGQLWQQNRRVEARSRQLSSAKHTLTRRQIEGGGTHLVPTVTVP